jgi:tetratricopeptide (TPR) repeat protein
LHKRFSLIITYAFLLSIGPGNPGAEEPATESKEEEKVSPIADAAGAVLAGIEPAGEPQTRTEFLEALDNAVRFSVGGDKAEAATAYLALIAGGYNRTEPLYNLGVLAEHDEKGTRYAGDDLDYAAGFYIAALAEDPDYHPARLNLAVVYHNAGLVNDAAIEYRKMLNTNSPEEDVARYNLALIVIEQGRYDEAVELLEGAEEPYGDVRRLMVLALLNEKIGARGRAIKLWKRAMAEETVGPFAVVAERHLRELRGY